MSKILFVCLGNICRSPVAEGILLHLNHKYELGLEIDSAGTASYHIGKPPDRRTITNARKNGIDLSTLRARQLSREDLARFESIYVMDRENLSEVLLLADPEQQKKVRLLMDLLYPGENVEVPDPYYGNDQDFETVFQMIFQACQVLAQRR